MLGEESVGVERGAGLNGGGWSHVEAAGEDEHRSN